MTRLLAADSSPLQPSQTLTALSRSFHLPCLILEALLQDNHSQSEINQAGKVRFQNFLLYQEKDSSVLAHTWHTPDFLSTKDFASTISCLTVKQARCMKRTTDSCKQRIQLYKQSQFERALESLRTAHWLTTSDQGRLIKHLSNVGHQSWSQFCQSILVESN